jgi:ATP/maltotriose-dependent transcriptional regulator MalT
MANHDGTDKPAALEWAKKSIQFFQQKGRRDPMRLSAAFNTCGDVHFTLGELDEAHARYREALRVAEGTTPQISYYAAAARVNICRVLAASNRAAEFDAEFQNADAVCALHGYWLHRSRLEQARVALVLRKRDEAMLIRGFARAFAYALQVNNRFVIDDVRTMLLQALLSQNATTATLRGVEKEVSHMVDVSADPATAPACRSDPRYLDALKAWLIEPTPIGPLAV